MNLTCLEIPETQFFARSCNLKSDCILGQSRPIGRNYCLDILHCSEGALNGDSQMSLTKSSFEILAHLAATAELLLVSSFELQTVQQVVLQSGPCPIPNPVTEQKVSHEMPLWQAFAES
ncbi:hypothetical protein AAC387_Pa03g0270 [Persea americana]